ncbi:uncharacterized protein LOC112003995 [Quercus suber]|uniref:uncharacterized protein LOC112003995 n=1 Tax=Quercus suber TaxID=58331 RepID=UPI0032DECAD9
MSCLAWNCRGLENLRTGRELVEITRAKDPSVVFLAETLTDDARLEIVQRSIEHDHRWLVPREGRGGGLALFWKSSINLTVVDSSKYYIHAVINKDLDNEWRLTGFYGEPETARRTEAWDKLRYLNSQSNTPWLCIGDFNEITRQDEKVGGRIRPHNQMQLFSEVIDECGFMDLGYVGPKFTWARHFENGSSIWERLDRGLATNSWFLKFPGTKVHHLRCDSSNHIPLHIIFSGLDPHNRKKPFCFEEMWLSNPGCNEIVEVVWHSSSTTGSSEGILQRVEKCGRDLSWWNRNVFGNVRRELEKLRNLLLKAEGVAVLSGDNTWVRQLKKDIEVLRDREGNHRGTWEGAGYFE